MHRSTRHNCKAKPLLTQLLWLHLRRRPCDSQLPHLLLHLIILLQQQVLRNQRLCLLLQLPLQLQSPRPRTGLWCCLPSLLPLQQQVAQLWGHLPQPKPRLLFLLLFKLPLLWPPRRQAPVHLTKIKKTAAQNRALALFPFRLEARL